MTACLRCGKKFGKFLWKTVYSIPYDKCQGKTCPDCGKIRKLGWYETIVIYNPKLFSQCVKCGETTDSHTDKICVKCFLERERKRGCVCFFDKGYDKERGHHDNINYYCPLCEEVHPREALCKECFEKQIGRNEFKRVFFRFIFPSLIFGVIIGFLIGWLLFKKLRKLKIPSKS